MGLTFGGKSLAEVVRERPPTQQPQRAVPATDPFPKAKELRKGNTQKQLLSVFADNLIWLDEMLLEMSKLARKQWRLQERIKKPSLQDHPKIGDARVEHADIRYQLADYSLRIQLLEIAQERYWQAMDIETRGGYGMEFNLEGPEIDTIIGQTWKHKAKRYKWPVGYTVPSERWREIPAPWWPELLSDVAGYPLGKEAE